MFNCTITLQLNIMYFSLISARASGFRHFIRRFNLVGTTCVVVLRRTIRSLFFGGHSLWFTRTANVRYIFFARTNYTLFRVMQKQFPSIPLGANNFGNFFPSCLFRRRAILSRPVSSVHLIFAFYLGGDNVAVAFCPLDSLHSCRPPRDRPVRANNFVKTAIKLPDPLRWKYIVSMHSNKIIVIYETKTLRRKNGPLLSVFALPPRVQTRINRFNNYALLKHYHHRHFGFGTATHIQLAAALRCGAAVPLSYAHGTFPAQKAHCFPNFCARIGARKQNYHQTPPRNFAAMSFGFIPSARISYLGCYIL